MDQRQCRVCGTEFVPKQARSSLCGRKACELKGGPPCVECGKPSRARRLCATHYNRRYHPDRHPRVKAVCAHCGLVCEKDASQVRRYVNVFCSDRCKGAHRASTPEGREQIAKWQASGAAASRSASARAIARRKLRAAAKGTRGWGVLVAGVCARPNCGQPFVRRHRPTVTPSPFCSSECRRTERQRQRGIDDAQRLRILERDGWRCRIEDCGKPIDREAKIPRPLSATVDHLLPKAAGGGDEDANLRAAHFICNSRRRDRGTVQLALIG